jgi:hypothetical protein
MLHNVRLLQRRFPESARTIVLVLASLSAGGLGVGIGLLLLR